MSPLRRDYEFIAHVTYRHKQAEVAIFYSLKKNPDGRTSLKEDCAAALVKPKKTSSQSPFFLFHDFLQFFV